MRTFHHMLPTREGRILADELTYPSSMTIFVHLFIRSVIQKVTIVILNTIFRTQKGGNLRIQFRNQTNMHLFFYNHQERFDFQLNHCWCFIMGFAIATSNFSCYIWSVEIGEHEKRTDEHLQYLISLCLHVRLTYSSTSSFPHFPFM